jgi:hypothetical protein
MAHCLYCGLLHCVHSHRFNWNAPFPYEIRGEGQEEGGVMKMCNRHFVYEARCEDCVEQRKSESPPTVLDKAIQIVNSERQAEYGDPVENRVRASLVAAGMGRLLTPRDVVLAELSTKIVRVGRGTKEDTKIDIAGYAEILDRIDRADADGDLKMIAQTLLPWLFK